MGGQPDVTDDTGVSLCTPLSALVQIYLFVEREKSLF